MNKYSLIVLITIGIISVALFAYYRDTRGNDQDQRSVPVSDAMKTSTEKVPELPALDVNTILYTDSGFSPNPLHIKAGTVVTYVNKSSHKMWPASAMHPTHREYPTTGGCLGSTFDACRGLEPGESWDFKFDIVGSWNYHDHLAPTNYGKIIVE